MMSTIVRIQLYVQFSITYLAISCKSLRISRQIDFRVVIIVDFMVVIMVDFMVDVEIAHLFIQLFHGVMMETFKLRVFRGLEG